MNLLSDFHQAHERSGSIIYRDGLLQPIDAVLPGVSTSAIDELESLINSVGAAERDFQVFFERNHFLLTGLDFKTAHAQPILYKDDGSKLIPDFFLEKMEGGWDAIVDLKRANGDLVVRRRNRTYFHHHVQNAIAQLRFYQEWFESPSNRRLFEEHWHVQTFRPKMVIVIGRRHHFQGDVERLRLLSGLPDRLEVWTYDDLLTKARRFRSLFTSAGKTSR